MEKAKRKLIKTGANYTYMLTLPKEWIRQLGWRAKQMVQLELRETEIVIRDYQNG